MSAIDEARTLFRSISHPDVISHNSMSEDWTIIVCCSLRLVLSFLVNAYARNGMGSDAINVYREMPKHVRDQVSHVCVLNACSHAGLIDQARSIFSEIRMKTGNIVGTMVRSFHRWTISIIIGLGRLSFSYVHVRWSAATDRRLWNISSTLPSDVQWVSHRSEWINQFMDREDDQCVHVSF